MSNTVTVSIPRGVDSVDNTHTKITAVKVNENDETLSLFRGEKLHAIYNRGQWNYLVTEPSGEEARDDEGEAPEGVKKIQAAAPLSGHMVSLTELSRQAQGAALLEGRRITGSPRYFLRTIPLGEDSIEALAAEWDTELAS